MKTLRLMTCMALASALMIAGCSTGDDRPFDEDSGTGDDDGGVTLMDSGPGDSGGGTDSGGGGTDSGGGGDDGGSGGMCPDGDCNILTNDGCDVGQACQYLADGPTCVEAGLGGDDEPCSGPTDCQEGFGCVGPSDGDSFCQPYCCESDGDCPTGQSCNVSVGDGSGVVLFYVCELADDCDLVEQTGCDPGEGCYPNSSTEGTVICDPAGSGTQGDTCESRSACESGFVCAGEPLTCTKICDPTAGAPDCPDGTSCSGRLSGFPDDVGLCIADSG